MKKKLLLLLAICCLAFSGCLTTVEYGGFKYSRWFEESSIESLTITTPEGLQVNLKGRETKETLSSLTELLKAVK